MSIENPNTIDKHPIEVYVLTVHDSTTKYHTIYLRSDIGTYYMNGNSDSKSELNKEQIGKLIFFLQKHVENNNEQKNNLG